MQTVNALATYQSIQCTPDDTTVVFPSKPRTKGLDITGQGGDLLINGGDLGGNRVQLFGTFGDILLSNLHGDFSAVQQDAIDINCTADTLWLDRCRFTGINGIQSGHHGDGLQMQNAGKVKRIIVSNTTIATCYQAFMMVGDGNTGLLEEIIFLNVNVRDEPALRQQMSVAWEMQIVSKTARVVFVNCWADWPDAGHALAGCAATIIGAINQGVPPGGDFCPA